MTSPASPGTRKPAVFLDRDGTLNEDVGYTHAPEDLALRPGVLEGLGTLARLGLPLVVVTDQGGIGLGRFDEAAMHRFNAALELEVEPAGVRFAGFYWCPHHPRAVHAALRGACSCRKPEPGLVERAAEDHGLDLPASFLIGDKERDMECGRRARCTTILVPYQTIRTSPNADFVANDFFQAAKTVERVISSRRTPIDPKREGTPHGSP